MVYNLITCAGLLAITLAGKLPHQRNGAVLLSFGII